MAKVVNIEKCFEKFNDTYSPKIVGNVNEFLIICILANSSFVRLKN